MYAFAWIYSFKSISLELTIDACHIASDLGLPIYQRSLSPSTAFSSQEANGMSGYEVYNHSDLTLSSQATVTSESNSAAVGG